VPIDEIRVKGVRGVRKEVSISLSGKSLLIHGDNGTGKSSIERALRWALLGTEVPSDSPAFSDEGSFRRHVLEPLQNAKVRIVLVKGGSIAVGSSGAETDGTGESYRDGCMKGNPFLRRSEILSFLSSRPVDRFTYLETFLDLGTVDLTAKRYADTAEGDSAKLKTWKGTHERTLLALSSRLPEALRPKAPGWGRFQDSCLEYGMTLSLLQAGQTHKWPAVTAAGTKAKELSEGDQLEKTRIKLQESEAVMTGLREKLLAKPLPDIDRLAKKTELLKETTADGAIAELLDHARVHFETTGANTCPVCRNAVEPQRILDDLTERLRNLESYRNAEKELRVALGIWRSVLVQFVPACRKVVANMQLGHISQLDGTLVAPTGVDILDNIEEETDDARILAGIIAVGAEQISRWIEAVIKATEKRVKKELGSLPAASSLGDLRIFAALVKEADEKKTSVVQLEADVGVLERRVSTITKISEALRKARQDVARETVDEISNDVATYYKMVHPEGEPGEVTGVPSLKIQRHGKGTAFILGKFAGKEVQDPNWVYSDGHLDTVGICMFLALRRFRGNQVDDPKLIVLDDVILSIDLPHARRLIELLKKVFSDHQILILTHNGLFAHWCSKLLPGMKRMAINGWTLEDGPQLGDYLSAMEALEKCLADQPAKQIALQVMSLMDEWLAECRYAYSLAVPAKFGEQYTMTEIWEPFVKTVKKMGTQLATGMGDAVKLVDELRDLPAIRNALAAHENEFAKEFPRSAMVDVGKKCLALVRSLYCPDCLAFASPVPNRFDPSIIHCDCHRIQYVKPSPRK